MITRDSQDIARFCIAGINYKKTDAAIRGQFAISDEQYSNLISLAPNFGIKEFFVLSTCNRTEIYGLASDSSSLVNLLCTQTQGSKEVFNELAYIKQGPDAIEHLFQVGAGLDSQILGDYEIVGQIKTAVKFAKQYGLIGAFIERLVNSVLQSSKTIKNQTALSGGTVSVSFAAVQYIREKVLKVAKKKILLIGVGKIGRNTCKNLVDYLETKNITLINRSPEKAEELAEELGVKCAPVSQLKNKIAESDIILVATNATDPTILKTDLENTSSKLIIDLSIPYNVEASASALPNVTVVNVDELSKLKDETLQKREAEVPKAKAIIAEHMDEFFEWHEMRKHVPVLKAVKLKLQEIHCDPFFINNLSANYSVSNKEPHHQRIQKVINGMAIKMRTENQRGCHYIQAINEFIAPAAN
jgi:glutamyl-tRNA reductase